MYKGKLKGDVQKIYLMYEFHIVQRYFVIWHKKINWFTVPNLSFTTLIHGKRNVSQFNVAFY